MPCYDSRDSPEYQRRALGEDYGEEEIRKVEERYGVRATRKDLARAVACELAEVLRAHEMLSKRYGLSKLALKWIHFHRADDKRHLERKAEGPGN